MAPNSRSKPRRRCASKCRTKPRPGRRQRHEIAALVAGNVAPLDQLQIPQPAKDRGHRRFLDAEAAAEVARARWTDDMERHRHDDFVLGVAAIAVAGAVQDRIDVGEEVPHEGGDALVEQGGGGGFGHYRAVRNGTVRIRTVYA